MDEHKTSWQEVRYWLIILVWLMIAATCIYYLPHAGKPFKIGSIQEPTSESSLGQKIIEKQFDYSGDRLFILYSSEKYTAHSNTFSSEVKKSLKGLDDLPFDTRVLSPYQHEKQISDDKHEAYAVVETKLKPEVLATKLEAVRSVLGTPDKIDRVIGGQASYTNDVYRLSERNLIRGELIALPICFIVMVFVFGGFLPALITIIAGVISVLLITTILYFLGHRMDLTVFVLNIATMLGLGLSLDYTLLLTYRFREEYAKCKRCGRAIKRTLATAGKSIFFSGLIVLISIASLIFFPINMLSSIGVAGIVIVTVTVVCTLTFLPPMLCLFEKRVNRTIPQLIKLTGENIHNHSWYRYAMTIMRYPILFLIPTIIVLVMLGYPFLHVKLSSSDAKILPAWVESRQVLDQFADNYGTSELSPIVIVVKTPAKSITNKANIGRLYDYTRSIKKDPAVKRIVSIVNLDPDHTKAEYQQLYGMEKLPFDKEQKQFFENTAKGQYTLINVISKYPSNDARSIELVKRLRSQAIPTPLTKQVTGTTADMIDSMKVIYELFFKMMLIISAVTYIALVWLLRSLLLPLKAILMNFLSLSVCYGMLVFIFQEGHFAHFLHFKPLGYTDLVLPIMLFFVLFGLSMDYEVFLLTRIKEYYDRTHDNTRSVAMGIERSARIITSAALIAIIVTGAFVTADIVFIKAFGLCTALAIAIDATLIRLLLVPTTMRLMGSWNWYLPKFLDRLLPELEFEREPGPSCRLKEPETKQKEPVE